jgi:hypothetical protein
MEDGVSVVEEALSAAPDDLVPAEDGVPAVGESLSAAPDDLAPAEDGVPGEEEAICIARTDAVGVLFTALFDVQVLFAALPVEEEEEAEVLLVKLSLGTKLLSPISSSCSLSPLVLLEDSSSLLSESSSDDENTCIC